LHPEVIQTPEALEAERNMIASPDRIHKKANPA